MPRDTNHLDALDRYQGYRDAAFHLTWDEMRHEVPSGCDLKVMPIDTRAMAYWSALRDMNYLNERANFDWLKIFQQVLNTPRRFDVAIWDGDTLCGMACGMASRGDAYVTVKWLERFRTDSSHGLKGLIAEIALTSADHYAAIIGRSTVRLKNPLRGTENLYNALGFRDVQMDRGMKYLTRQV